MLLCLFKALFALIPVSSWIIAANAQVCSQNGILAGIETTNRSEVATTNTRYLLKQKGTINCYGVIREWVFHTNDLCNSGDINFEVWRQTAVTNDYELVGVNTFTSADCPVQTDDVTFGVASVERIPVQPGYIIGWFQPSPSPRISGDPSSMTSAGIYSTGPTGPRNPGVTETFADQPAQDFSLKVTVMKGEEPTIDNLPATVNLAEDVILSPPIVIFTVIASHICNANKYNYKDAVPLNLTLSPIGVPFAIQNTTTATNGLADVTAIGPIDYETQSVYQLEVTVTGLGLSTSKVLTVNIVDVNEPHNITNLPNSTSVHAPSTAAAIEVFKVLISDPDTNPTVPVKFYLQSWTSPETTNDVPPFVVNPDSGSVTSSTDLSTWHLDNPTNTPYPTTINYTLTIIATDGVTIKTGDLTISITNVRQPPVFLNLPDRITIDENLPGNTVVFQVLVETSADPVIRYEIIDLLTPFCIDEFSGEISLCSYAKLDYCLSSTYTVQVNATNSALSNVSSLTVNLQWINSLPSFSQTTYSGTITEKCTPVPPNCNQLVTAVAVNDRDLFCSPQPGYSVICSIIPGSGSTYFSVTGCTAVINITPIDVDNNPQDENIILLIEVRDSGGLTGYAKVVIKVINTNDFNPTFIPGSYVGSVIENAPGGTSVLTVTAKDGDSGKNGEFEYSILSTDAAFPFFEVDPSTGRIETKQPLDREKQPSYSFNVWAKDKGIPSSRSGSAFVIVNIIDVNDVRPTIECTNRPSDEPYDTTSPCFYNFDLKYDALIGQNVSNLTFSATDRDPQPNSITFNLLVPDANFNMDDMNGMISVKQPVTEYTKYLLYVYAKDNGTTNLWSRIMNVRIDTYRPDRQFIDLTVRPTTSSFDQSAFLDALRKVTVPWFMKIASRTTFDPNVQKELIVTVYALADNSTYSPDNIIYPKIFVDRDDMLNRLRKNIYGDPADILKDPTFDEFPVIKVMPTYMNWWLDTVEGIATIVCLSVLGLLLLTLAGVGICKWLGLLCFKQKTPPKPIHAWVDEQPKPVRSMDEDSVRYRSAHGRRESISTVHSIIVDKNL